MGKTSRDKGARGEREAAAFLSQWFPEAKRGVSQTRGGVEGPDITGCYGLWVENKRLNAITTAGWVRKAEMDLAVAATSLPYVGVQPIVLMREDRGNFLVAVDATWFFNEYTAARPWIKNGEKK